MLHELINELKQKVDALYMASSASTEQEFEAQTELFEEISELFENIENRLEDE